MVIDTWQKGPHAVLDTAKITKDKTGHYMYVSSISVYKDRMTKNIDENYDLVDLSETQITDERMRYGHRKAWAEKVIFDEFGDKATTLRSHGMRSDRTPDRIYEPYWPVKFWRGGEILLPKDKDHVLQCTDVKSMAEFMVTLAENGKTGAFNVARGTVSFESYVNQVDQVTRKPHTKVWVPAEFVKEQGIEPYRHLPFWRPQLTGFYHINNKKALAAGLHNRSIGEMVTDQLRGYLRRNPNDDYFFGGRGTISPQKEKQVLDAWKQRAAV